MSGRACLECCIRIFVCACMYVCVCLSVYDSVCVFVCLWVRVLNLVSVHAFMYFLCNVCECSVTQTA